MSSDAFDLARFVEAQALNYDEALEELRLGKNRSDWSSYMLPHLAGLGVASRWPRYAVAGLAEARSYLAHATLGGRLVEVVELLARRGDRSAVRIFGMAAAQRVWSCLTLFHVAADRHMPCFRVALQAHFDGHEDPATLRILSRDAVPPRQRDCRR